MLVVETRLYPADCALYDPVQVPPAVRVPISYGRHWSSLDVVAFAPSSKTYAVSPVVGWLNQLLSVLPFAVVVGGMMIVDATGVVHEIELPMV